METPPLLVLWGKAGCRRQKPDTPPQQKRTAPEISPGPFTVCDLLPSPEGAALHLVHGGDRRSGAGS